MILKDKLNRSPLAANNHTARTPKAVFQQIRTLMRDVNEEPTFENVDEIVQYIIENFPELTPDEVEKIYRELLGWLDEIEESK